MQVYVTLKHYAQTLHLLSRMARGTAPDAQRGQFLSDSVWTRC